MEYVIVTFLGLAAGWFVNLAADTVPDRLPFFSHWYQPFFKMPTLFVEKVSKPLLSPFLSRSPEKMAEVDQMTPSTRHIVSWLGALSLAWLTYFHSGVSLTTLIMATYSWFFLAVAAIDLEHRKVYNRMLLAALPVMLFFTPFIEGPSLFSALAGGIFGFLIFLVLALIYPGGMGMGDVKLAGVIGVVTGFPGVIVAILVCIFSGGFMAALLLMRTKFKRGQTMAYAPYLVLGAWIALFYGTELWVAYMSI